MHFVFAMHAASDKIGERKPTDGKSRTLRPLYPTSGAESADRVPINPPGPAIGFVVDGRSGPIVFTNPESTRKPAGAVVPETDNVLLMMLRLQVVTMPTTRMCPPDRCQWRGMACL